MSSAVELDFLPHFQPLFVRDGTYRHKVFHGGRSGTKSHSVARALMLLAKDNKMRILCAREIQNSIKDSVKLLLEDVLKSFAEAGIMREDDFWVKDQEIEFKNGSMVMFSGLYRNIDSLKGLEGVDICWIEEAETVSEYSLRKLGPTIRKANSEIWYTFNPERLHSPMWQKFCIGAPPPRSYVCKITYLDNPWASRETIEDAEDCKAKDIDAYRHIWLGEPVTFAKGSYYAKFLQNAQEEQRITRLPYEPLLQVHTAWDLGISDSTSIWFFQYSKFGEYRIIDHYSNSGEGLPHYADILTQKGYSYGQHIAPHDIAVRELGSGKSRLEIAAGLGINFTTCPNIGVADGIQAVRTVLPKCYFDSEKCADGLESLWAYQREWDEKANMFKDRPLHDWSSHDADAFRYLAVGFKPPVQFDRSKFNKKKRIM